MHSDVVQCNLKYVGKQLAKSVLRLHPTGICHWIILICKQQAQSVWRLNLSGIGLYIFAL